jgi:malonate transporter and related proteins
MMVLLEIIAPVFGIIALGYALGRAGALSDTSVRGIADFAFIIALPALMFKTISVAQFTSVAPLGILLSFFGAVACVWLLSTLATRTLLNAPATDAPALAMTSAFGNTIMLGFPIALAAFGPDAAAPIAVILALHTPLLFASATLHSGLVETDKSASNAAAITTLARDLLNQPIILAILAAALWRMTSLGLPSPVLTILDMLAKSGIPTALIALGLSLRNLSLHGQIPAVSMTLALKLIAMPLIAALLAGPVLALPPLSAKVVILFAALPAGANAYLYATRSGNGPSEAVASTAVAVGTVLSALTLSLVIAMLTQ